MARACSQFKEFLAEEREALQEAMDKHRARLSRRLGRQVSEKQAEADFVEHRIWSFCKEFRDEYCGHCCDRAKCELHKLKAKKSVAKNRAIVRKTVKKSLRCRRATKKKVVRMRM